MILTDSEDMKKEKRWPTLAEVLAKPEWREDDITVLVAHQDELDDETLAKLGVKKTREQAPTESGEAQTANEGRAFGQDEVPAPVEEEATTEADASTAEPAAKKPAAKK